MSGHIEARLAALGITLPAAAAPAANYAPFVKHEGLVIISGQLPLVDGKPLHSGMLGRDITLDQGVAAARASAINIIAQLKAALDGDLDRTRQCLKLGGFVQATPDFTDHPKVINGASDLIAEVFGDAGRHARFAVGAASLPLGVSVEVEAMFAVD